jgi:ADP-ribose pyrophosphatase
VEPDLTERVVESRVIHRGSYLEFRVDTVERADGSRATRDIAGHPGAVAVVALDDQDRIALVRQWRLPAKSALLEIPAGGLDVHDDGSKEDPDLAARRELEEETGLRAGSWQKLTTFYSAPGFTDELMHLYLATALTEATADDRRHPEEDERLVVSWMPWREAVAAVESGEIRDSKSIVGLLWLERMRRDTRSDDAVGAAADPFSEATRGPDVAIASYSLTLGEFVSANVVAARRSKGTLVVGGLLLLLGLGTTLLTGELLLNIPPIVFGLAFVTGWFAAPIAWWQGRKRRDLLEAPALVRLDASGLTSRMTTAESHHAWSTFRHVHDRGGFFFLDTDAGTNIVIPKRAFSPTDLATVYRLLDRNGLLPGGR